MKRGREIIALRVVLIIILFFLQSISVESGEIADNIRKALKEGADPNALFKADFMKIRPLHAVVGNTDDHLEAAGLLLEAGADPDGRDELGNTPLHRASSRLAFRFIRLLLKHRANPNLRNDNGETPLHQLYNSASYLAYKKVSIKEQQQIKNNLIQTARILLEKGADPNIADKLGGTPLYKLAGVADAELLTLLLEYGADPQRKDNRNKTPLEEAIFRNDDPEATEVFLKHGAGQIDIELFIRAIENQRAQQALLLLRYGAPVKGTNKAGYSPLYSAVMEALVMGKSKARMELIRELLSRGAPQDSRGPLGGTAKELAKKDPAIFALFESIASKKTGTNKAEGTYPERSPKVEEVVKTIMLKVNRYGRTQAELNPRAMEAADLATLNSPDEIPQRIVILERYRKAVEDMIGVLRAAPGLTAEEARKRGLDKVSIKEVFEETKNSIEKAGATAIIRKLQAERDWAKAVIDAWKLLAANRGRWSPEDAPDGTPISIYDRSFVDTFRRAARKIVEAEKRANAATRAIDKAKRK